MLVTCVKVDVARSVDNLACRVFGRASTSSACAQTVVRHRLRIVVGSLMRVRRSSRGACARLPERPEYWISLASPLALQACAARGAHVCGSDLRENAASNQVFELSAHWLRETATSDSSSELHVEREPVAGEVGARDEPLIAVRERPP